MVRPGYIGTPLEVAKFRKLWAKAFQKPAHLLLGWACVGGEADTLLLLLA
jgi:hypothetical protein